MDDIGWDGIGREVIHSFIKTSMLGSLDSRGFRVIPHNILGSVRDETKKDTFARVGDELGRASSRWAHPHSTTKGAEGREVVFLAKGLQQRWGCLILGGDGVLDPEVVMEGIRPEAGIQTCTK